MKTTEKKLLSNEEIASFCSQAAMLFQAGIPPVEGMAILQSDAQSPEGKAIFEEILTVCRQGESFHKALEATKVFPDYCLHMIALGEESGNLDVCMSSLADYYEKEDAIAGSIRDAVTYPFIMIAMMAAVIVVLVSRVMPIFEQVYIELGSEMTGFAASLLRLGNHLNRYSFIFVSILCILLLLYLFATRTQTGKRVTARFLNWFPLTRRFYESVACERFASGTLSSGMDTYSSLDMVAALVGNEKMKQKILSCKEAINAGANFAEALTGAGIFNHLYSQMEQSVFFFLVADDSCSKESIRAVSDVVQQYRFTPIQPFFPIEVQEDSRKIEQIITANPAYLLLLPDHFFGSALAAIFSDDLHITSFSSSTNVSGSSSLSMENQRRTAVRKASQKNVTNSF